MLSNWTPQVDPDWWRSGGGHEHRSTVGHRTSVPHAHPATVGGPFNLEREIREILDD
jgi:hypothetical protein